MKNRILIAVLGIACICSYGCSQEKKNKDRDEATDMFNRICKLTEDYTGKLKEAPDSSNWATLCSEYEDKLYKINFSYPPDTDLLLTEGQNDTIHSLMLDYIKARDERIQNILHPIVEADTLQTDSTNVAETGNEVSQAHASRNHGN